MTVEVYDADDPSNIADLSKHDFVGRFSFHMAQLVSSMDQSISGVLEGGKRKKLGKVTINAEERKPDYGKFQCGFSLSLKTSKPGPVFFTLNQFIGPGRFQPVYKSECVNQLKGKFTFSQVVIDTDTLCRNDELE